MPMIAAPPAPAPTPAPPVPSPLVPSVLIVDDSRVDRRLAAAILEKRGGLRVAAVEDGQRALEFLSRETPSAVVTDLQMPGLSGLELVEAIRRDHPGIPVILMTAHGSEDIALRALRAGASSYVPKKSIARILAGTIDDVIAAAASDQSRRKLLRCLESRRAGFVLENDPALIAPLVAILQEDLVGFGLCDQNDRMRVGVALQETLANALYHGNLEVSSDLRQDDESAFHALARERRGTKPYESRRIHVTADLDRREATFTVRDEGPGFDTSRLDAPLDPENLMRIGGRGLLLIRTFMDEVRHNPIGNEITLVKRKAAG